MRAGWLKSVSMLAMLTGAWPALAQTTAPTERVPDPPAEEQTDIQEQASIEEQGGIEEIVVTAQRRAESVQDVPIAISAFSADQLAAQGVSNTLQLGQFVPNLVAQNNTGIGSANAYFLRGLGNTETISTFDPPVGTYVDDIYLSRQNANNLSLFDVERVEVLRGPQGTLFGRNTTGGAINVILRQPGRAYGGYAEIGYGRFDKKLARASIDVPIGNDGARGGIKISGFYQNDDGYVRNVTTGQRINDDDGFGVRVGVRYELTPDVEWNGSYAHLAADGENILNFECNPAAPTQCNGRFATTGLRSGGGAQTSPYAPLVIAGRKANLLQGNNTDTDLFTSRFEIGLGEQTLSLITGFVSIGQQFALDFGDGRGLPSLANPIPPVRGFARGGFDILNDGEHRQFTQEVKVNGALFDGFVDYVAGAFYINERNRTDFADVFSISPTFVLLLGDRVLRNKTTAYAGYVQADVNVTEQIKLTAGVRYTDEKKTFRIRDNRPQCNAGGTLPVTCLDNRNLIAPSGIAIPDEQRVKIFTPRFAANFQPNRDMLFFVSATRGFKSGGWNARSTAASQLLPFDPEKVWSYEAGLKTDLFDRRVRFNLTAFYLDVTDLQTPAALVAANGSITFLTRNFADYRNQGLEAELTLQPFEGLNLYANAGYQDDKYKIDRNAPVTDIYGIQSVAAQQAACAAQLAAGRIAGGPMTPACAAGIVAADASIATPVRTPEFSLAVGGSYRLALGSGGLGLLPSVNASYRSEQEVSTTNLTLYTGGITGTNGTFTANPNGGDFITGSNSPGAWLVNAGLALQGPDDRFRVSVECTNCFDETFVQSSLANYSYLNQPRMYMVRGRVNF